MKYTTKPRMKSFKLSYNRKKDFAVTFTPRATQWKDLKNYTYILNISRSAVYNDIGMSMNGGKKPRQYATI